MDRYLGNDTISQDKVPMCLAQRIFVTYNTNIKQLPSKPPNFYTVKLQSNSKPNRTILIL